MTEIPGQPVLAGREPSPSPARGLPGLLRRHGDREETQSRCRQGRGHRGLPGPAAARPLPSGPCRVTSRGPRAPDWPPPPPVSRGRRPGPAPRAGAAAVPAHSLLGPPCARSSADVPGSPPSPRDRTRPPPPAHGPAGSPPPPRASAATASASPGFPARAGAADRACRHER